LKRKIIITADGSKTIQIEDWNEQYHSKHGAIQEAQHVFIKSGLNHFLSKRESQAKTLEISILEIGFGTGLNAFLTFLEAQEKKIHIHYVGIEAFPVANKEIEQLNYPELISLENESYFRTLHNVSWGNEHEISQNFALTKREQFFADIKDVNQYDIIYFDAFGARVQPELWRKEIFEIMFKALKPKGVLVTYAAIGEVKRNMQALGFTVERLQGPPGKRHMLRATK